MNIHFIKLLAAESAKNLALLVLSMVLLIAASVKIVGLFLPEQDSNQTFTPKKTAPHKIIGAHDRLFTKPLFGTNTTVIKPSQLNIKIVGILFANDKVSQVILEEDNLEKVYKIGDVLRNGAVVHEINAKDIVIDNNNKLERLNLPQNTIHFVKPAKILVEE